MRLLLRPEVPDWFRATGLYPILDRDMCRRRGLEPAAVLETWRRHNSGSPGQPITYYQWRAKGLSPADYLAMAAELRAAAPDLALIANDCLAALDSPLFAGLHLGQTDLAEITESGALHASVRERPDFLRGLSTHSARQIARWALSAPEFVESRNSLDAGLNWSYLALGPCFPTGSKPTGTDPVLSADAFRAALTALAGRFADSSEESGGSFPLVLIGGISAANLGALIGPVRSILHVGRIRPVIAGIGAFLDPVQFSGLAAEFERECG